MQVLDGFNGQSCLFASPTRCVLGHGIALCARPDNQQGQLATQVSDLLQQASRQGLPHAVVMGAIPFDALQTGCFRVPAQTRILPALPSSARSGSATPSHNRIISQAQHPSGADYEAMVTHALQQMAAAPAQLQKVVLARRLILRLSQALDRRTVLDNMLRGNAGGYTFMLPLSGDHRRDPDTLLGISPELLVRRSGTQITLKPLAGTCTRDPDPEKDKALGQALLHSDKDRREHAFVVDAVRQALQALCDTLEIPAAPSLTATHNLWHLATPISGRLRDPATSSLQLTLALHPTPAICGTPTRQAMRAIRQLERFNRGLYAGAVGWEDATGDGEWAIAIRCAHYREQTLTLTAGAGIVTGSVPRLECLETGNKLKSLLTRLGLAHTTDILQEDV